MASRWPPIVRSARLGSASGSSERHRLSASPRAAPVAFTRPELPDASGHKKAPPTREG